jgi:hypothetical protein
MELNDEPYDILAQLRKEAQEEIDHIGQFGAVRRPNPCHGAGLQVHAERVHLGATVEYLRHRHHPGIKSAHHGKCPRCDFTFIAYQAEATVPPHRVFRLDADD